MKKNITKIEDFYNFIKSQLDRLQKDVQFYVNFMKLNGSDVKKFNINVGIYIKNDKEETFQYFNRMEALTQSYKMFDYTYGIENCDAYCNVFKAEIDKILKSRKK